MKISTLWPTLGAGALALLVAGGLFAAGTSSSANAADKPDATLTKSLAPELSARQSGHDVLPSYLLEGPQSFESVVPASTRVIGVVHGVTYWLANDDRGWTCLISLQPGPDELATMACDTAEQIWKKGLALQVASPLVSVRSYFLPAGYSGAVAGLEQSGQLLIGDASHASKSIKVAPPKNPHAVKSASGETVGASTLELPALPAAGGNN